MYDKLIDIMLYDDVMVFVQFVFFGQPINMWSRWGQPFKQSGDFSQFCVKRSCRKALNEQCADFRGRKCFGAECMSVLDIQSEVSCEQPVPKGGVRALSCRRKVMH